MTQQKSKTTGVFFKNIGLVARRNTPEIEADLLELANFLIAQKTCVYINEQELPNADLLTQIGCRIAEEGILEKVCDLIIVLGGDGTLLTVARKAVPYKVPLVGINQGRLGFMTDIPKNMMIEPIAQILDGQFISEERTLMEAVVVRDGKEINHALALNDVVFSRGAMGQLIEFEVFIDDLFVYTQRSDGLIIATPTGSTAYALSAGGPILAPTLPAITLVPICPQSMNNRPIVVNDNVEVRFLLTKGGDTRVHFDGQSPFDLAESDQVFIRRYQNKLRILHPQNYDYYNTLRQKLHWGGRLV